MVVVVHLRYIQKLQNTLALDRAVLIWIGIEKYKSVLLVTYLLA
jgi:hypothetical protein